jgi:hypothetical protein
MAVLVKIPYYVQAPVAQKDPEAKPLSPFWVPLVPEDRSVTDRYDVYVARKDLDAARTVLRTGAILENFTVAPYSVKGLDVDAIETKTNEGTEVLKHLVYLDWESPSLVITEPKKARDASSGLQKRAALLNATADAVADETS